MVKKFTHEYICIGPTYQSADGEYRYRFVPFKQIELLWDSLPDVVNPAEAQILKWLKTKALNLQSESFFPKTFKGNQSNLGKQLDNERMVTKLYVIAWLLEYNRFHDQSMENHLVPGYKEAFYDPEEEAFYEKKIFPIMGSSTGNAVFRYMHVLPSETQRTFTTMCGQKFIPLRIQDVEDAENLKFAPWREMYASARVGDLVINGISPSFPIFVDWMFLGTNSNELYDNKISQIKLNHSLVASEIIQQIEDARKHTYELGEKGDEVYLSYKMEGLSEAIDIPISYAEKEIVMSPITLCSLTEHVGRTFADMPNMMEKPWYAKHMGDIFGNYNVFSKYLFEYIYALYCMNSRFHTIHSDLHLNNITMYTHRHYYNDVLDKKETTSLVLNAHIVYDLGDKNDDSINNTYIWPHYGKFACIIDFSRAFIGTVQLEKDYPEHKVSEFVSSQRRRILRVISHEVPEFYKTHKDDIEALLLQNFDVAFKLLTALDTHKLASGMMSLMLSKGLAQNDKIMKLLRKVQGEALTYLTVEMQRAINRQIKSVDDFEWPNLKILQDCFKHGLLSNFDQRAGRRDDVDAEISIIDVFQRRNDMNYNIREYEKFPPGVKLDYVQKNNIPTNEWGLKNYAAVSKRNAKNPPDEAVKAITKEVKDSRDDRRGTTKIHAEKKASGIRLPESDDESSL